MNQPNFQNFIGALMPQDMAANGAWFSMKGLHSVTIVIMKSAGGAAEIPTFTLQQATAIAGTGVKGLNFPVYYTRTGAPVGGAWTKTIKPTNNSTLTPAAGNTVDLYIFEVDASMLDVNGGFDCVRVTASEPGATAQLCAILAIGQPARYGADNVIDASAN